MAPPLDANRFTRQLGRETLGQVGQTWLHIRTIVQRRHPAASQSADIASGR